MSITKFKYGDRVQVTRKSLKTNGYKGTILGNYGEKSYWVQFADGVRLCYREANLTLLSELCGNNEKENNQMYITGDFKVAKVFD